MIEMNPRVSRSSALASKATGFPIAKIAARLAVGYLLEEITNDITGVTPASFEPTIDYVVVKWPRFAFEKFPGALPTLSTHMKSVGEAMALGRTFSQAFAKALRSRELDKPPSPHERSDVELLDALTTPTADRYETILELLARAAAAEPAQPGALGPASRRFASAPRSTRGSCESWPRSPPTPRLRSRESAASSRSTPARPSFPARTPYYYSGWERKAAHEVVRGERSVGGDPRRRTQPHRPGDRVRLLLCARRHDRARVRARRGHRQLQPGDGLDRLRHLRPALFRAAHARGRARRDRGRAGRWQSPRRDRPVRRTDPSEAGGRPGGGGRAGPGHLRSTRSTWPRIARASASCWRSSATTRPPTRPPARCTRP